MLKFAENRTIEICRKHCSTYDRTKLSVAYYLTADICPEETAATQYGIGAEVIETGERRTIRKITCSLRDAMALLDLAATGCVTPMTLPYIVEDWLGAC